MSQMHALHKILIAHANPKPATVKPGDFLELEPDVFAFQMATNVQDVDTLEADLLDLGVKELPLKDKMFVFMDHGAPAPTGAYAAGQKRWREFYRARGIPMQDGGSGISHLIMAEQGVIFPGALLALKDSHTPTSGAIGAFAASLAGGRLSLMATGKYWIDVPKVSLVRIEGTLQKGVFGRDVALHICGRLGQRGALNRSVEFSGSFVRQLSMDMRFTLCNMGTEIGATSSYIQPDDITKAWCDRHVKRPYDVYETDPGYQYDSIHEFDVSDLGPQIAIPHAPDNVKSIREVEGQPVDQAFLGSCASGRLEDIAIAASIIRGHKVHPNTRFIVTPGSREVLKAATRLGYIEILHEANAIVTNANCGACVGMSGGILAPGETAISCNTRNFDGRMGAKARIFLGSPAVVSASAIEGRIADPLPYL